MMKRLLFALMMVTGMFCQAQISQDLRKEFLPSEEIDQLSVALFENKGLIAFGYESLKGSSGKRYTFFKLDTELKTVGKATVDLPKLFHVQEYEVSGNELVVLFMTSKGGVWRLSVLNFDDMKVTNFNGNLKNRTVFQAMEVCGDNVYVANTLKTKPNLLVINKRTGKTQFTPLISTRGKRQWIVNLESDTASGQTYVYLGYYIKGTNTGIDVLLYNKDGQQIETMVLSGINDHNLTEISATMVGPEQYIFVGTYSRFTADRGEGFFIAEIKEGDRSYIEYHNYLDLKDFTSFLPSTKQARIEKKKARMDARGKEMSMTSYMVPHRMVVHNDKYFFLGEFYYKTYYTETHTRTVNGQVQTTTVKVFDGYQYTHSVIAGFDKEGNLLWNSPFEMWFDFKPMKLYRFVTFSVSPEGRVDLMFTSRGSVFFKSLDSEGNVINDRSYSGMETGKDNDKLVGSASMIEHWYDNKFIAYGYQSIKEVGKSTVKKKRKVMFIDVMSVE